MNNTVTFEMTMHVHTIFYLLQEHIVLMEQFVLLEDPTVQKDMLKYAVVDHGVLSVMTHGTIGMLL